MGSFVPRLVMVLALLVGGGSLVPFGWFVIVGPPVRLDLLRSDAGRLGWDALLCLLFFAQHSGMVRRGVKDRLSRVVPALYGPALYAIASGVALSAVLVLWQTTEGVVVHFDGPARWVSGAVVLAGLAVLAWGVLALGALDTFGTSPLRAALRGAPAPPAAFVARGPYRLVRHPLYLGMLMLIWSAPRLTLDRLLFDVLWTAWIVLATRLEERDLAAEFGAAYREYQRTVPMLLPSPRRAWRRARGVASGP